MDCWKREQVFHDGDKYFNTLSASLTLAQKTIDLETYIFTRKKLGIRILNILQKKASQGVKVRLLLDGVGCSEWDAHSIQELNNKGVQTKIYHPMIWMLFYEKNQFRFPGVYQIREVLRAIWSLNRRNHRKVCIIDGKLAFAGGMNVSDVYLTETSGNHAWRDSGVCFEGSDVRLLVQAFDAVWKKSRKRKRWFNPIQNLLRKHVRLNDTLTKRRSYHRDLVVRILESKKRIWITTPYLVPEISFIRALRYASRSGVDTRLIVPKKNDVPFMTLANSAFYSILLESGVQIYEYVPRILHAKVMLIDEWSIIGSSNRNHRSLIHDLEVDIVLSHLESLHSVEAQFKKDLELSQQVTVEKWRKRSWLNSILGRALLIFKYWI